MKRLTKRVGNRIQLEGCVDGECFQRLIEKLAEYEDLDEKGLIKRETKPAGQGAINGKEILDMLLNQITALTQADTDFNIAEVIPAYCERRHMCEEYDGLFWGNEGATWKYKRDLEVVKLVDTYFVTYRKLNYPELPHRNVSICVSGDEWSRTKYPCRYDYLKDYENLIL